MATPLPDKRFFKIGEVAALVGVKTHVLRYWESELGTLRPLKTRGAHRMYRREDVDVLCRLRGMLQEDGLTLAAAKKRLAEVPHVREIQRSPGARRGSEPAEGRADPALPAPRGDAARALSLRAELLHVRSELADLLASLDAPEKSEKSGQIGSATVTAVVPKTVLMQRAAITPRRE